MIKVRTPTRIDLAGGTLDLLPLHQFVYPRIYSTVNLAINVFNEVELKKTDTVKILIESIDLDDVVEFDDFNSLHTFLLSEKPSPLMLAIKSIDFFGIEGVKMKINSAAPKGSGLGNSSSMLIAIIVALNILTGKKYGDKEILDIAQAIETSIIKIPTGCQDYIAALYGGFNKVEHGVVERRITHLPFTMIEEKFNQTAILCYIGEPKRYTSPIENPNWDIFKSVVEKKDKTLFHLNQISDVTIELVNAVENEDWESVVRCFSRESEHRSKLGKTVISDDLKSFLDLIDGQDIDTFKICGAGGGGCILLITSNKKEIEEFLRIKGIAIIEFKVHHEGVEIIEEN